MAYDVARVRGLHPSLGDGWVHLDAQLGMLVPESVATTVSTAFRGSRPDARGPHPGARRSAAVLDAARQAVGDLVNADSRGPGYINYFPEGYLCQWFRQQGEEMSVYCFHRTGVILRSGCALLWLRSC